MAVDPQLVSLTFQVVELLGRFFSGKRDYDWGRPIRPREGDQDLDLSTARAVSEWLARRSTGRTKEALRDLEGDPIAEDNKADLRKQLAKQLEEDPALRADFLRVLPEGFSRNDLDAVVMNVGKALSSANVVTGSFNTIKID